MSEDGPSNDRDRTVIVGASLGGLRVAEGLRRAGYAGAIDLVGDEAALPYDRPPLSKDVLMGTMDAADTQFRSAEELAANDITVRTDCRAGALDVTAKTIQLGDEAVRYDHLVIASGARARTLPGTDRIDGVFGIRTRSDAESLVAALADATSVVVVGAGFIGAEAASSARTRGLDVTVVEALDHPLEGAIGRQAGAACAQLHTDNGTTLLTGTGVADLNATDAKVRGVVLADGRELPADVVIVGIGVIPNTDWLEGSGLTIDNGVVCDEYLAAHDAVYALGDVCRWHNPRYGQSMRVEHWTTTVDQSAVVANNIARPDKRRPCDAVPYFWSDQYGSRIQFAGRTGEFVEIDADPAHAAYMGLYRDGDAFVGALTIDGTKALMTLNARLLTNTTGWDDTVTFVRESYGA